MTEPSISPEMADWAKAMAAHAKAEAEYADLQSLIPSMVDLVREIGKASPFGLDTSPVEWCQRARAIMQQLPKPVDPDVLEVRQIVAASYGPTRTADGELYDGIAPQRVEDIKNGNGDEYWEAKAVLEGFKHGRTMAQLKAGKFPIGPKGQRYA